MQGFRSNRSVKGGMTGVAQGEAACSGLSTPVPGFHGSLTAIRESLVCLPRVFPDVVCMTGGRSSGVARIKACFGSGRPRPTSFRADSHDSFRSWQVPFPVQALATARLQTGSVEGAGTSDHTDWNQRAWRGKPWTSS